MQQRPVSPTVTLTWHVSKYKVNKLHQRYFLRFWSRTISRTAGTVFVAEPQWMEVISGRTLQLMFRLREVESGCGGYCDYNERYIKGTAALKCRVERCHY